MSDTSDSPAVVPHKLGDLFDVDTSTMDPGSTGGVIYWDDAAGEWKAIAPTALTLTGAAPAAAITGGESPTEVEFNALRAIVAANVIDIAAMREVLEARKIVKD